MMFGIHVILCKIGQPISYVILNFRKTNEILTLCTVCPKYVPGNRNRNVAFGYCELYSYIIFIYNFY